MANIKCNICGTEFPPIMERHYISEDTTETGVVTVFKGTTEPKQFDTFDCPNCGCQVIVQERKHRALDSFREWAEEHEEEDEADSDESPA